MDPRYLMEMRMAFGVGLDRRNAHAVIKGITTYDDPPKPPLRWRNLVNGYVEALGLDVFPVRRPRSCGYISEHGTLPPAGESSFATGVRFDGRIYLRDDDGLAWSLAA